MHFRWNLQLVTRYSLYRNLLCSTTNLLIFEAIRIYVALNTSGVTWTVALDILKVFWKERAYHWPSSQNFTLQLKFSTTVVSVMMFYVKSELVILLSNHHGTNHLICCNMLRYAMSSNLILKYKIVGKYF